MPTNSATLFRLEIRCTANLQEHYATLRKEEISYSERPLLAGGNSRASCNQCDSRFAPSEDSAVVHLWIDTRTCWRFNLAHEQGYRDFGQFKTMNFFQHPLRQQPHYPR